MTKLSVEQIQRYQQDGIVFPVRILADDEVRFFRDALESIATDCGGAGALKRFDTLHLFFDWAYRLVTNVALLDAVESLLGNNILVDGTLVFYKPPRDTSFVSWHQDSVYSGWNLTPSTSAWIALTPSHAANGCMRVIPGSHKQGLLGHANVPAGPNLLRRGEQVATGVDESTAVDVVLKPGEMSLHHSTIIHGSNPNASAEPRIGFIVRFVTNESTNRERALLRVRGDADCSHLELAAPPAVQDRQTAFKAWREFTSVV